MAKSFIGVDTDDNTLRVVALEEVGKELKTVALVQRDISASGNTAEAIAEILNEWDSSNCRLAMSLPAGRVLARPLEFPFGDRRKIAAAVPLELGSQLPRSLDDHLVAALPPVAAEGRFRTIGLAVPKEEIETALSPLDAQQLPLRFLGIEPFVYAGQLNKQPADCLLLSIRSDMISTLLIQNGTPAAYRNSFRGDTHSPTEIVARIKRDVISLQKAAGYGDLPVIMFGPGLNEPLQELLGKALPAAELPDEAFEGNRLPAEFIPALALARLSAAPEQSTNLRQGEYAFRGSLAPFKKQLIAAAVLLSLSFLTLLGGAWLSWSGKASIVKNIEQQMAEIYSQTIPGADNIPKDIPLHMTSRLNAARDQSELFGGISAAPLAILETVTRAVPENSTTLVRELGYDENGIRLTGQAKSFDAVDRLAAGLKKEPLFGSVRISDAKTNIDGKQVDFRIDAGFAGKGGQ